MVPKINSPCSALLLEPGMFSRIQAILVAEKYASITRPVLRRIVFSMPAFFICSQIGVVRRHCHTMALDTGRPVWRSHKREVSR